MPRRALAYLFASAFAATAVAAVFAACTSAPSTSECAPCASDVDCEQGVACSDGVCLRRCTKDSDCPIGLGCAPLEQGDVGRSCACPGETLEAGGQ